MSEIAPPAGTPQRRRADAEHNIAAILDAAVDVLGERPDASMADIAAAAGVARQTVYAHYESRDALLGAVAQRALAQAVGAIDAAKPQRGSAADALDRLVRAWWETVGSHARVLGALATVFSDTGEIHDFHSPILERLERLVRRGQRAGEFDRTLPARWVATAFLGLMHTAAEEVAAGRVDPDEALHALERTVPRVFGVGA